MEFASMGLKEEILKGIRDLYFEKPTPIQEQAIPLALEGKDLIGQAKTGTGKTAAFVIPMLQKIDPNSRSIQGLIMTPTRELAIQIAEDTADLGKYLGVQVLALHGGRDIQAQINKLKGNVQIVVGTPGRILDHLRRETLHFGRIKMLVLDEADKMLEMGFQEDVEQIIATSGTKKQTLLFSATMPDQVRQLAHRFMFQPPHIKADMDRATSETTKQYYYVVNQSDKMEVLTGLLEEMKPYLAIIFVNTQERVKHVTEQLQLQGYEAEALHGGLSQNKREQLMEAFRQIKFQYLVCTDIAARGVDVEGVTHVFNYDLPNDTESYIHRIGRTGRAGQEGTAVTLVSPRQKAIIQKIEKSIRQKIEERLVTGGKGFMDVPKESSKKKRGQDRPVRNRNNQPEAKPAEQSNKPAAKAKKVKPGYRKKLALAKEREERQQKRQKIKQSINRTIREKKRKEAKKA